MKTRFLALVALLVLAAGTTRAQLYDQWASMEFKQWSFSPTSYYYSKYWTRLVDMPWPIPDIYGYKPGEGYHDKGIWEPLTNTYIPVIFNPYALAAGHWDAVYSPDGYVNQRWRQQIGLRTPASADAVLYKQESNKEEEYWSKIRTLDIATIADRSGVLSGLTGATTVTASERQESMDAVNEAYDLIEGDENKEHMMEEYYSLQEKVSVIDGAHMDNARKLVALQSINQEYKELKQRVVNTVLLQLFHKQNKEAFKGLKEEHSWVDELVKDLGLDDGWSKVINLVDLNKL